MKRAVRFTCVLAHQAVFWLVFGVLPGRAAPPADELHPRVYVQTIGEADELAAQRLDVLIGRPLERLGREASPVDVVQNDDTAVVIVLDGASARVTRHRKADPEPLVRTLDAPQPSPYQLAFVAAEILPLDGPLRVPPPPAPRELTRAHGLFRVQGAASGAVAGVSPLLELGAAVGAALALSDVRTLELELDAGFGSGRRRSYGDGELSLSRTRVRLRASLVRRLGTLEGGLGVELGLARSFARVDGQPEQSRRSVSAAVRAEGRALLGPHWGLFAAGSFGAQGARHAFEVMGERLARERRYYAEAQLGLLFVMGDRAGSVHQAGGLE